MEWTNILGNAVGVVIGSIIGSLLTDRNEKGKERRQEQKENYKNKPELIVSKAEFKDEKEVDMSLLLAVFETDQNINFSYSSEYKNRDEYVFKDYIFKNIGKNPIEELEIVITNKGFVSIFDINSAKYFIDNEAINYGCMWDKKIFPNQEIKIRLYFHKDRVITSTFSCAFIMQFQDSNGLYWEQPFFESDYKVYSPRKISYKEYRENTSIKKAMECFEKPWLW